jgi:hypothetical protein
MTSAAGEDPSASAPRITVAKLTSRAAAAARGEPGCRAGQWVYRRNLGYHGVPPIANSWGVAILHQDLVSGPGSADHPVIVTRAW